MDNTEINNADYTVLVVDDIQDNVTLLDAFLRRAGFKVVSASNGKDALEWLQKEDVDVMLLDIMMPEMDGFEVLRRLQQDPVHRDLPVIVVTALGGQDDIAHAFNLGASDFITKPIMYQNLITRVSHQLRYAVVVNTIRQQSEQLRRTIGVRDRMYSVIAHDLRSPIGTMKMIFEVLLDQLPVEKVGEDARAFLVDGSYVSEQTFMLLDNLLKWTKSQLDRFEAALQDVPLRETVIFSSYIFKYMAQAKSVTIEYDIPESLTVRCDVEMLKTVVRNMLSNALKFSKENSVINVRANDVGDGTVRLDFIDHGVGMTSDQVAKFNSAEPLKSTYGTSNEEGSGLGLMLCRELVGKFGGALTVVSKEGEGTTFSLTMKKA